MLSAPCAGRGLCGGCGVRVVSGTLEPADEVESRTLERAPEGVRLACRACVPGPVEVRPLFSTTTVHVQTQAEAVVESGGEAGTRRTGALAAGIDLGTTSVAALLVDAQSGREIARASVANQQAAFGADVLSRVSAALDGQAAQLRTLAEHSVADALHRAAQAGGVDEARVVRLVVAANSAMAGLFVGADVGSLAAHPFTPPIGGGPLPEDSEVRAMLAPGARASLAAPMAAFVGGDALAATVAAGLVDAEGPMLLVDLGTNAELVLARPPGLLVASTAAGPAFEGVGVSCGGPATAGAVDRVEVSGHSVSIHSIDDAAPLWFSGAGIVSAIAALLAAGHIAADGGLSALGPLADRFVRDDAGVLGVRLSATGAPALVLTQLDVRAVQLAKAAVRAGIEALMLRGNTSASQLVEILVAGAFGAALDPNDLVAIGVLPSNAAARIRRVGNAALEGAALMALDSRVVDIAERTARQAEHVDLAADPAFNARFIAATEFRRYEA